LEKELDITLFDRSSGKMKLTAEGRLLFEKVVSLFEIVKSIRSDFDKERVKCQGAITIVAAHPIIDTFLAPYITNFIRKYPQVMFHVEGASIERVIEKLETAQADIGIAYSDALPKNIQCFQLFETGQRLIVPRKNRSLIETFPSLETIAKLPLILFSLTDTIPPYYESIFAKKRLNPNIIMMSNNYTTIKNYVAKGLGNALLGGYAISTGDKRRFAIYSMDKYFPKRKYGLLMRKGKYLSPAVKAFIVTLRKNRRSFETPENGQML
jgi:DNA-binding transcriptional LysR family regulator